MFLIAVPRYFLGRMRELRARLEEPRRSELGGGAKRLTCRVMSHSLCQHGLPAAGRAIHEDASGRVDADLKHRGGEEREPGSPSPAGDMVGAASPFPASSSSSPACRAQSALGGAPRPPAPPASGCPCPRCPRTSRLASDLVGEQSWGSQPGPQGPLRPPWPWAPPHLR